MKTLSRKRMIAHAMAEMYASMYTRRRAPTLNNVQRDSTRPAASASTCQKSFRTHTEQEQRAPSDNKSTLGASAPVHMARGCRQRGLIVKPKKVATSEKTTNTNATIRAGMLIAISGSAHASHSLPSPCITSERCLCGSMHRAG
eukprot:2381440-Rhodomonas_salina.2